MACLQVITWKKIVRTPYHWTFKENLIAYVVVDYGYQQFW